MAYLYKEGLAGKKNSTTFADGIARDTHGDIINPTALSGRQTGSFLQERSGRQTVEIYRQCGREPRRKSHVREAKHSTHNEPFFHAGRLPSYRGVATMAGRGGAWPAD